MRFAAYSLRLGGPRSYENGVIDIGGVVLDGDEFTSEYYALLSPDDNKSYRPGYLKLAGVSFDMMMKSGVKPEHGCTDFMEWASDFPGVWCFDSEVFPGFINSAMRNASLSNGDRAPRFTRGASVTGLYDILRAFGTKGPTMGDHLSLMRWVGLDPLGFHELNALEQAKQAALTLAKLQEKLGAQLGGNEVVPATKELGICNG